MTATAGTEICTIWTPIYWSQKDTDFTIQQVKLNNAARKTICDDPDTP